MNSERRNGNKDAINPHSRTSTLLELGSLSVHQQVANHAPDVGNARGGEYI